MANKSILTDEQVEAGITPDTYGDYIDDGEVYYDAP